MTDYSNSLIKSTRKTIRKKTIKTIIEQFDDKLMNLEKDKRIEKYEKMAVNSFGFFRGSAYLFYYDITSMPMPYHTDKLNPTWIQGDLHFENFGTFQNEDGKIVFDVNDFDEGYIGSYLYDLIRMSISIILYCESFKYKIEEINSLIQAFIQSYYKQMDLFANGESAIKLDFDKDDTKGPINKLIQKMEELKGDNFLEEITEISNGFRKFSLSEEIFSVSDTEKENIQNIWKPYLNSLDKKKVEQKWSIKDIALKKGSGTASIGLKRYYILAQSEENKEEIVLEMKEVRVPILAYFLPYNSIFWEICTHNGERVITVQKAMHHKVDPYLGQTSIGNNQFYIRERSPYKKKLKTKNFEDIKDLNTTLKTMGKITAKIHARADLELYDKIMNKDCEKEIIKSIGDIESFSRFIICLANSYSKQVKMDYEIFLEFFEEFKK